MDAMGEAVRVFDVALLQIDGAVFHQVPARGQVDPNGDEVEPVLSTMPSKLDNRLEHFLRDRLMRTFKEAAQPVAEDPDLPSPTPALVREALDEGDTADFVARFHPLAPLLLDVQAHNSPQGLLAVLRGSCGSTRVIVILKVEQERGLSFDTQVDGDEVRVEVVIEDGLVFTEKTEVFKASVFYLDDDGFLRGLLTDEQSGSVYRGPASQYWLSDFLGCRLTRLADVVTRAWIDVVKKTIAGDLKSAAEKDAVFTAMKAELASNRGNIDPRKFIEDHVPEHAQDAALSRLSDEGVPRSRFPKSTEVSSKSPARKRFLFDNGLEVRMPNDVTPDLSTETVDGHEVDVLTIRGRIRRVFD